MNKAPYPTVLRPVSSANNMRSLGKTVFEHRVHRSEGASVIALDGELGSGKTTLSQGILSLLGAREPFPSPTFAIILRYDLPNVVDGIARVYHIDAYRVDADALRDLDWEGMCNDTEALILIEWAQRVASLLPHPRLCVHCAHTSNKSRTVTLTRCV